MEIRVLKYFLTVAREQNITKAAESLYITQPTLSRQIHQLESELGVRLFDRDKRKLTLTGEGLLLRKRAEDIIEITEKTEHDLIELSDEKITGCISIGTGIFSSTYFLSDIISRFKAQYPGVSFDIYTGNTDDILERIEHGLTDIGLVLGLPEEKRYHTAPVPIQELWGLLAKAGTFSADKKYITAAEMKQVPVMVSSRQILFDELTQWCGKHKLCMSITGNMSSSVFVESGICCAFVLKGSILNYDKEKFHFIPLYPELTSATAFIWPRYRPFSKAVTRFTAFLTDAVKAL